MLSPSRFICCGSRAGPNGPRSKGSAAPCSAPLRRARTATRPRLSWWLSPERFKTAIAATIPKVALEFSIAIDAKTSLQDYAGIAAPTLLIAGSKTRAPTRAIADLLAGALPNARLAILPGAGHMSPFTHPAELNRLILDHLRSVR